MEGEDFSGTNNQEAGVDEADFVKPTATTSTILRGTNFTSLAFLNLAPLKLPQR